MKVQMPDGSEWFTEETPLVTKGSGTEDDPYHVATATQLNMVRHHPDKHYIQTADIDLADYNWEPIPSLSGVYDGNGKTIESLKINKPDNPENTGVGLFASLAGVGVLKNITLVSVDVKGYREVGSLEGLSYGTIENCSAEGNVSGYGIVGGLVGVLSTAFVTNSYYDMERTRQNDEGKGEPRTTDEMWTGTPSDTIYTGWSTEIWDFGGDDDYPVLK